MYVSFTSVSFLMTMAAWLASCNTKTSSSHGGISYSNDILRDTKRLKRAGTIVGMGSFKAIKSLLRGAKELTSTGPTRTFVKFGNYIHASKDFIRAHPTERQAFRLPGGHRGMSGKIGDKEILLRSSNSDGRPIIEVRSIGDSTTKGQITHKIKYTGNVF